MAILTSDVVTENGIPLDQYIKMLENRIDYQKYTFQIAEITGKITSADDPDNPRTAGYFPLDNLSFRYENDNHARAALSNNGDGSLHLVTDYNVMWLVSFHVDFSISKAVAVDNNISGIRQYFRLFNKTSGASLSASGYEVHSLDLNSSANTLALHYYFTTMLETHTSSADIDVVPQFYLGAARGSFTVDWVKIFALVFPNYLG